VLGLIWDAATKYLAHALTLKSCQLKKALPPAMQLSPLLTTLGTHLPRVIDLVEASTDDRLILLRQRLPCAINFIQQVKNSPDYYHQCFQENFTNGFLKFVRDLFDYAKSYDGCPVDFDWEEPQTLDDDETETYNQQADGVRSP
jgi:hypothetical protein